MQLIDRALQVLEILSSHKDGMAITELAERIGIPASSAHRIVNSLKENHYVFQDRDSKYYRLSYKLFSLASEMQHNHTLCDTAKPLLRKLSDQINKTVVLCIMDNYKVINIDCIERRDSGMYMVKIGDALPLYSTSAGRIFLSYMEREEAVAILDKENRTKSTPFTKTEISELNETMDFVRRNGYALIDEELQLGIRGVACPVFDLNGEVVAAIAFTMQKTADDQILLEEIRELKKCAADITAEIS